MLWGSNVEGAAEKPRDVLILLFLLICFQSNSEIFYLVPEAKTTKCNLLCHLLTWKMWNKVDVPSAPPVPPHVCSSTSGR